MLQFPHTLKCRRYVALARKWLEFLLNLPEVNSRNQNGRGFVRLDISTHSVFLLLYAALDLSQDVMSPLQG